MDSLVVGPSSGVLRFLLLYQMTKMPTATNRINPPITVPTISPTDGVVSSGYPLNEGAVGGLAGGCGGGGAGDGGGGGGETTIKRFIEETLI